MESVFFNWKTDNVNFTAKNLTAESYQLEAIHSESKQCWKSPIIDVAYSKKVTEGVFKQPFDKLKNLIKDAVQSKSGINYKMRLRDEEIDLEFIVPIYDE
eukprot:TRINITY_DN15981_c0_g1_i1.p2 TRINITY_DN15981_c0_g1~~TRINITY_DN15981_c0_g1_i1.p2  ORF type:complete len:100 (+),score=24.78 TRINITY_DN15981_c0_g1_i1:35-334(+)